MNNEVVTIKLLVPRYQAVTLSVKHSYSSPSLFPIMHNFTEVMGGLELFPQQVSLTPIPTRIFDDVVKRDHSSFPYQRAVHFEVPTATYV
jgi:hypothetical protein